MKLIVEEDLVAKAYRVQQAKQAMHTIIPRVALVGYTISAIATVVVNFFVQMKPGVFWTAIVAPTSTMLLYLYFGPLAIHRFEKRRWKITKKRISTSDGFRVPLKRLSNWGRRECPGLPDYTQIYFQIQYRFTSSLNLKGPDLEAVVEAFRTHGIPEDSAENPTPTPSAPSA